MKKIFWTIAIFLMVPLSASATVRINEIAWMGYPTQYAEWVELYNDTDEPADITGWTLFAEGDKKLSVSLSGTVAPKGYFLIAKNSSSAIPNATPDLMYSGAYMSNSGEILVLKNASGLEIERIDNSGGWEKGNSATKETMQRSGSLWITSSATPRAANNTTDTSATPDESSDEEDDNADTVSPPKSSDTPDLSAHVSPLPISDFNQKQEWYISAGRNRIVSAGTPVLFEAYAVDAKGAKQQNFSATWSFGDGAQAGGIKASHSYKYPGEYAVILNASAGGNEAVSRAEIKVFSPKIVIAVENDGAVSLLNESEYEINLGGWKISGAAGIFSAASDTLLKAGKKIIFPKEITAVDFSGSDFVELFSPNGASVAFFTKPKPVEASLLPTVPPAAEKPAVLPSPSAPVLPETAFLPAPLPKKAERQLAISAFALPENSEPKEKTSDSVSEKIVIAKREGWFEKLWNFLF